MNMSKNEVTVRHDLWLHAASEVDDLRHRCSWEVRLPLYHFLLTLVHFLEILLLTPRVKGVP